MSKITVNAVALDVIKNNEKYELKISSKAIAEVGEMNIKGKNVKDKEVKEEIVKNIEVIEKDSKIPVDTLDVEIDKEKKEGEQEQKEVKEEEKEQEQEQKNIDDILNSGDDMLI